jgi:hypothetical protein
MVMKKDGYLSYANVMAAMRKRKGKVLFFQLVGFKVSIDFHASWFQV